MTQNPIMQKAEGSQLARRRGRQTFLGLAALFFVPLALSFWLYYSGGWRPARSTNHGEIITPALRLEKAALSKPDGSSARVELLTGQWSLLYLGAGQCDADCQHTLYVMRQTRLTLANDMTRVRRVFIATSNCCNVDFFNREHAGLEVVAASDPATRDFLAQFPQTDRSHSIFVVDPLGNLMMRFDARQNPQGLKSDLTQLLKLSHIG